MGKYPYEMETKLMKRRITIMSVALSNTLISLGSRIYQANTIQGHEVSAKILFDLQVCTNIRIIGSLIYFSFT